MFVRRLVVLKKQHKFILFFSIILLTITIVIGAYIESKDCINKVNVTFESGKAQETLSLFCCDDVYYAFLPSHANIKTMQIQTPSGYKLKINNTFINNPSDSFDFEINTKYKLQLTNLLGIEIASETLIVLQSKNIPSISITLFDGTIREIHSDRNISKTGILQTTYSDDTIDFRGTFKAFHGRGNTSWAQEKKSYTIEFEQETSLLSMDSGTKWLLISNCFDESSLRNKLVYDAAKEFNVKFAIDSEYVDLYINNQYMGLYLLCEKIEVSPSSVNITDLQEKTQQVNLSKLSSYPQFQENINGSVCKGFAIPFTPLDITGGYLLQIDYHTGTIHQESSFFKTKKTPIIVSSPKNISKEQIVYISDYITDIEQQIGSGDLSKIDTESFITQIIFMEYFANTDNCSVFLFKDSDQYVNKLFCGPLWDYDLSMGNMWKKTITKPCNLMATSVSLFEMLYNDENFYSALKKSYEQNFHNQLNNFVTEKLSLYKNLIEASFTMDKMRWKYAESNDDATNTSQIRFDTLDEHVCRIEDFLEQRSAFLRDIWINNVEYHSITFTDNLKIKETYHIRTGDILNIPYPNYTANNDKFEFVGWYDNNGNEYIPGKTITQDLVYSARLTVSEFSSTTQPEKTVSEKDSTAFAFFKSIFYKLTKIEFHLWCFGGICIFVIVIITRDLFLDKIFRRYKNGKRN